MEIVRIYLDEGSEIKKNFDERDYFYRNSFLIYKNALDLSIIPKFNKSEYKFLHYHEKGYHELFFHKVIDGDTEGTYSFSESRYCYDELPYSEFFVYACYDTENVVIDLLIDNCTLFPEYQISYPYKSISDYNELLHSNILFIQGGNFHQTFYHFAPIYLDETAPFTEELLKIHEHGVFTENSQQCCDFGMTDDEISYAFISGFMHKELAKFLKPYMDKRSIATWVIDFKDNLISIPKQELMDYPHILGQHEVFETYSLGKEMYPETYEKMKKSVEELKEVVEKNNEDSLEDYQYYLEKYQDFKNELDRMTHELDRMTPKSFYDEWLRNKTFNHEFLEYLNKDYVYYQIQSITPETIFMTPHLLDFTIAYTTTTIDLSEDVGNIKLWIRHQIETYGTFYLRWKDNKLWIIPANGKKNMYLIMELLEQDDELFRSFLMNEGFSDI